MIDLHRTYTNDLFWDSGECCVETIENFGLRLLKTEPKLNFENRNSFFWTVFTLFNQSKTQSSLVSKGDFD